MFTVNRKAVTEEQRILQQVILLELFEVETEKGEFDPVSGMREGSRVRVHAYRVSSAYVFRSRVLSGSKIRFGRPVGNDGTATGIAEGATKGKAK